MYVFNKLTGDCNMHPGITICQPQGKPRAAPLSNPVAGWWLQGGAEPYTWTSRTHFVMTCALGTGG